MTNLASEGRVCSHDILWPYPCQDCAAIVAEGRVNPDYVSEHLAPGIPRTDRFGRRVLTMAEKRQAIAMEAAPAVETGNTVSARKGDSAGRKASPNPSSGESPNA